MKSIPVRLFIGALLMVVALHPGTRGLFRPLAAPSVCAAAEREQPPPSPPAHYSFRIVRTYPHDPAAFTQGLVFLDGFLYESTGLSGRSSLRKVELETGRVVKQVSLPDRYFAEGLAAWGNLFFQLTWKSGQCFVYDRESFARVKEFSYPTEGWGITCDGRHLVMSDGGPTLRFRDPETFAEVRAVEVRDRRTPVRYLNELEFVRGEIFANIWGKDKIARISPQTGQVLGWIDLSGLKKELSPILRVDVLNGIAYDPGGDRLFVTGKLWPKLFEIELVPK